jgi:predicted NBD/HSP70 family sugar kinase
MDKKVGIVLSFLNYKEYRRYLVLNLIHSLGPISRTKLADITDYRPAAIGDIINELMEENLLVETGSAASGQGRHRTLLGLHSDYICALGISINASTIITNLLTIDGAVQESVSTRIHASGSIDELVQQTIQTIQSMLAQYSNRKILGIGICDPGPAPGHWDEAGDLFPTLIAFNDWVNHDLKSILQSRFDLPVAVFARGILTSIAEEKFGAAKGLKDFICLDLCNGVGMSFYVNGGVVRGANHVAGQIGDTVVHSNDRVCSCGKVGCVEASAAFPAVRANILGALERGVFSVLNSFYDSKQELTVSDVKRALDSNDKLCCHYIKESAQLLGLAIANAVNLLNPQCVFLHGYMIGLGDFFLQNLVDAIRENCMMVFSNVDIKVLSPSLEDDLPLGAAAVIFDDFLHADDFKWVKSLNVESSSS